jgi:hypothetical protein
LGCRYKVDVTDGTKTGSGATPIVTWSALPPFACTFTNPPSTATVNQPFSLSLNCNGTASSADWSAAPLGAQLTTAGTPTATSNSVTLPSAGIWAIQANVTGPGGATSSPVVSITANAPVNQTGAYNCGTSYSATKTLTIPAWAIGGGNNLVYSADAGGFASRDAFVVEIITPAQVGRNVFGSISWVEWLGVPATRIVALSDQPCDFDRGIGNNPDARSSAINGTIYFSAGPNDYGWPALPLPNTKYYLNIRNQNCTTATCNIRVEFGSPR